MKIMICCGAGMSSSVLVEQMKKAARKQGDDVEIRAMAAEALMQHLQFETYDVVMLGPQLAFMAARLEEFLKDKGPNGKAIPFEVINSLDYGRLRGAAVLARAKQLIKEKQK
ncbi:PTS sugar transporter subunit IIB [Ligilactobacillus agilis]|uniref:Cellobiose-specific PTS system IIB component n=1 Tax=Ligilactobacillus agilis TaxID=1601 RepID=A0A6F9Y3A5_9LACO|nr:PTS sugar transporter subunit IIB [Ligilactobacillus agilis]MBM6763829.1 PTS sugar transporter subunit IIB [Ligilactobacillus agilis]MDO4598545.1 PTS sugar transporter subunit IIB [Ligilactobacillus agilis]GET09474.1 cellobiose-specific PTS system IIB component [Ligilactobacillus agilis]GET11875.1 cellobiose-specific PTS system IIB component [Ligilactobacillus agilis]GET16617.1 cellobiose-specific PTS system IIB component [Ligilactobacillus agilis]